MHAIPEPLYPASDAERSFPVAALEVALYTGVCCRARAIDPATGLSDETGLFAERVSNAGSHLSVARDSAAARIGMGYPDNFDPQAGQRSCLVNAG